MKNASGDFLPKFIKLKLSWQYLLMLRLQRQFSKPNELPRFIYYE